MSWTFEKPLDATALRYPDPSAAVEEEAPRAQVRPCSLSTPGRALLRQLKSAAAVAGAWVAGHSTDQLLMAIKRPTSLARRYVPCLPVHEDPRPQEICRHSPRVNVGAVFGRARGPSTPAAWWYCAGSHNGAMQCDRGGGSGPQVRPYSALERVRGYWSIWVAIYQASHGANCSLGLICRNRRTAPPSSRQWHPLLPLILLAVKRR